MSLGTLNGALNVPILLILVCQYRFTANVFFLKLEGRLQVGYIFLVRLLSVRQIAESELFQDDGDPFVLFKLNYGLGFTQTIKSNQIGGTH